MKKLLILSLLAFSTSSVFANDNLKSKNQKPKQNVKKSEPSCRVTCSSTYYVQGGSYTVEVSAGSIFTSCETATTRCQQKLAEATTT